MKYIVQLFQEYDNAVDRDSYLMFQVIFSAKSIKEARKVSGSVFRKWKKEQEEDYGFSANHKYKKQTFLLKDFIQMKEKQFKVCFS